MEVNSGCVYLTRMMGERSLGREEWRGGEEMKRDGWVVGRGREDEGKGEEGTDKEGERKGSLSEKGGK